MRHRAHRGHRLLPGGGDYRAGHDAADGVRLGTLAHRTVAELPGEERARRRRGGAHSRSASPAVSIGWGR